MKPGVFIFEFVLDEEKTEIWGFIFSPKFYSITDNIYDEKWFNNTLDQLEIEYGVHDWSSSPSYEVIGIGYNSYEVEEDLIVELMEKWRKAFIQQSSENDVSELVKLNKLDKYPNDVEFYHLVKSQLNNKITW